MTFLSSVSFHLATGFFANAGGDEPDIQPGKNPDEDKPSDTPDEIEPSDTPDEDKPSDTPDEIPPGTPPEVGPDHLPRHPLEPGPFRDMASWKSLCVVLTDFAEEKLGEIRDERH